MRFVLLAPLAVTLVVAAGCKKSTGSSPEYDRARADFNALYGKHLEEAYVMEEMGPIESALESVPETSNDSDAANELLKRIRSGRERLLAREAEKQAAVEEALRPARDVPFTQREEPPEEDAGVVPTQPVKGMKLTEFQERFGRCFEPDVEIEVKGLGRHRSWKLRDLYDCRQQHSGFDQRVIVGDGEAIYAIVPRKDVEIVVVDAGVRQTPVPPTAPARPDGGQ